MPCSKCGAPMQVVADQRAQGVAALFCGYCHQSEALPPDAAERVRYLQQRLALLKQARESDEAPLRAVASMRRAWIPVLLLFAALVAYQLYQHVSQIRLLQKTAPEAVGHMVAPITFQLALIGGYALGYLGMSLAYGRAVKPLLRAKPPVAAGVALRCRSCGGDLPVVRASHVICGYCSAHNLLDSQVTQRAAQLLQQEIAAYQARAHGVYSADAFRAPTKAFYRWAIPGALIIGVIVASVLPPLIALLPLLG
ncbi:MAG TPA: hypothetical protein VI197_33370 [Polyangiaceae bacterium]